MPSLALSDRHLPLGVNERESEKRKKRAAAVPAVAAAAAAAASGFIAIIAANVSFLSSHSLSLFLLSLSFACMKWNPVLFWGDGDSETPGEREICAMINISERIKKGRGEITT